MLNVDQCAPQPPSTGRPIGHSFSLFLGAFNFLAPGIFLPAANASSNTVTIVSSGGAAQNSGWSVSAGVITVTNSVAINASDIVSQLSAGAIEIDADQINVNANISSPTANSLTLKATGNIIFADAITISLQGGNLTLDSDSANGTSGNIRLGDNNAAASGYLQTNGGNITLSGGSNPSTGYAMAGTSDQIVSYPAAGIDAYFYAIQAGGGNITIRGSSPSLSSTISTRAINFNAVNGNWNNISTTGSGTINIIGDGSLITHSNAWGALLSNVNISSGSGTINISGKGNTGSTPTNARGILLNPINIQSSAGSNVNITDLSNGSLFGYSGAYLGSAASTINTSGNIVIQADNLQYGAGLNLTCNSASFLPNTGNSFTSAQTIGALNASGCQNLTVGSATNTANITFSNALNVGGPLNVTGGAIAFNNSVTANNSTISLTATRNVTQSGAITCSALSLGGSGSCTLQNAANNFSTLAAGNSTKSINSLALSESSTALTIGSVSSSVGIHATGSINVANTIGELDLTQPVSSALSSGDAVKLYANSAAAAGTAGSDLKISGSGNVSINSGARALLYSGTATTSTGIVTLVGGYGNIRSNFDTSTAVASISPTLGSTGIYAIFRIAAIAPTAIAISVSPGVNGYQFGKVATITATLSGSDGLVTFFYNGKKIFHCTSISSASLSATCRWTMTAHGSVLLTATLAGGSSYSGSTSAPIFVHVISRVASH